MTTTTGYVPDLNQDRSNQPADTLLFHGPRGIAVRILSRVESSDSDVEKLIEAELRINEWTAYDRALIIELICGTLRWQARLDWVLTGFYHGEFSKCIVAVKNAMRVALYQLLMLSKIPPSIAINECVNLISRIKDQKSASIIAGVLKNILRNIDSIRYPNKDDNLQLFYAVTLSHPLWIVKRWCTLFGDEVCEKILGANNDRPSMYLCVNKRKASIDHVSEWLREHECTFEPLPLFDDVVRINGLQNIASMEIFEQAKVFACVPAELEAAKLARVEVGDNLLCFAPSASQLVLSLAHSAPNEASITLVSPFEALSRGIKNRLQHLDFNNVNVVESGQQGLLADLVVVEPAVSGLGLLAARPELRWRIETDSLRKSAVHQRSAIVEAASYVKPKGILLYCSRSFEPEETTEIISWFLNERPDFTVDDASAYCDPQYVNQGFMQARLDQQRGGNLFAARLVRRS